MASPTPNSSDFLDSTIRAFLEFAKANQFVFNKLTKYSTYLTNYAALDEAYETGHYTQSTASILVAYGVEAVIVGLEAPAIITAAGLLIVGGAAAYLVRYAFDQNGLNINASVQAIDNAVAGIANDIFNLGANPTAITQTQWDQLSQKLSNGVISNLQSMQNGSAGDLTATINNFLQNQNALNSYMSNNFVGLQNNISTLTPGSISVSQFLSGSSDNIGISNTSNLGSIGFQFADTAGNVSGSLITNNSNGTSTVATFSAVGGYWKIDSFSGSSGSGALTAEDQENDDGTSKITIYNPNGSSDTTTYSGPNGTGSITETEHDDPSGNRTISIPTGKTANIPANPNGRTTIYAGQNSVVIPGTTLNATIYGNGDFWVESEVSDGLQPNYGSAYTEEGSSGSGNINEYLVNGPNPDIIGQLFIQGVVTVPGPGIYATILTSVPPVNPDPVSPGGGNISFFDVQSNNIGVFYYVYHLNPDIRLTIGNDLPDVTASLSSSVATTLQSALAAVTQSSALPNVVTTSGSSTVPAVGGALNAYVVSGASAETTAVLAAGFAAGYLLDSSTSLSDSNGAAILVGAGANSTLSGAANDTLVGGDAGATLFATTGAETLIGGTGANAFFLGASTAQVTSQGQDTITGSSGAETVNASGSALYFGTSGATDFIASGAGGDTIIGGTNGNTVQGGGGSQLIFGSTSLNYTGGAGAATIIGGGTGNTVTGGAGNLLLFASSSMTYTGTGGAATVIGGGGPLYANLGTGGGVVYGSPGGNDTLSSDSATASVLVGGGDGDLITDTGSAKDVLVAGGGAETINAAAATGNLVIFGGPGSDVLSGGTGNDLFVTEPGSETLTGGGGTNSYVFINFGTTARTDVITDFNPSTDAIGLYGYGGEPGADAAALASATVVGGNTTVTLSDGTSIVFVGAPTLNSYNFY